MQQVMTLDQVRAVAPSVFATEPYRSVSDKYVFIPTLSVVERMMKEGFQPVSAGQSYTRLADKKGYVRHTLRFRHEQFTSNKAVIEALNRGEEIPELVLFNAHDGGASYQLDLGFFRFACSNKMIVSTASLETIRVRHVGSRDLVEDVIEASYKVIDEAPKVAENIAQWKALTLDRKEQEAYAMAALELRETNLEFLPGQMLLTRREEDRANDNGERSVWNTFNVVQENLTKGGMMTRGKTGRRERLKTVKGVDTDAKLNRSLWLLTEKMAELRAA